MNFKMNLVFTSKKTSFINQKKIIKKEINSNLEKSNTFQISTAKNMNKIIFKIKLLFTVKI